MVQPQLSEIRPTIGKVCAALSVIVALVLGSRMVLADSGDLANRDPFGVATGAPASVAYRRWMPLMREAGVKWARLGVSWRGIEPKRGVWNFQKLDSMIRVGAANGMYLDGLFLYNAPWINSNTHTFPMHHLRAWSKYVSKLVAHTRGKVDYYEVWNEPESFAAGGTAAEYGRLVRASYDVAKQANPHVRIGLSVHCVDVVYLQEAIQAGAVNHFDFICVHPYEVLGMVQHGWEGDYMSIVPTIRKMLAVYDPAKVNVPIWITEEGEQIGSYGATVTSQTRDIVKGYVMGIAEGFARIEWYQAMDGASAGMGLLTRNGYRRPAYRALQTTTRYIGAIPNYQGWVLLNHRDYGFIFKGAQGNVLFTWARPGNIDWIRFSGSVRIVDPATGMTRNLAAGTPLCLTNAPMLVVGVSARLAAEARYDKTQPFPWGGNYSHAASVSIRMGDPNHDRGLHQLNPNRSSTAANVYGTTARLCNDGSGHVMQCFEVDPNFISFRPRHVNITITARRNKRNTPAGFVVGYESTTGLKHNGAGGWWTIPGNNRWYTHTFKLSDAEFVGMWAYNFDINSDRPNKGGYYIKKIVVTK